MREVRRLTTVRRCFRTVAIKNKQNVKKEADRTFRCASPIFMTIAYYLGFTNGKQKYIEEKTTAILKSKQTLIVMVRNHLRTVASLPTLLPFHYILP